MNSSELTELRNFLEGASQGAVLETKTLERLLAACWGQFAGADSEGMEAYKLIGRTKAVSWDPPVLCFAIERHGGVALGSVYAEVQSWSIDLEQLTASCTRAPGPLDSKRQDRLQLEPPVNRITNAVQGGINDEWLEWRDKSRVRILVGRIIPTSAAAKQTVIARRKRLAKGIEMALTPLGWRKVSGTSPHTYERTTPPGNADHPIDSA